MSCILRIGRGGLLVLNSEDRAAYTAIERVLAVSPSIAQSERPLVVSRAMAGTGDDEEGVFLREDGIFEAARRDECDIPDRFVSLHTISSCFYVRFEEQITPAELGLLSLLLCGSTLREASANDGKSYDTKRNQLAALRSKSGVRTQGELVQIMSVLISSVVNAALDQGNKQIQRLEFLLHEYYRPNARLHRTSFGQGREFVVADIGPTNGYPCFLFSPTVEFFAPLPDRADFLSLANLRVYIPVRPGFFGQSVDLDDPEKSLTAFVDDCFSFMTAFRLTGLPVYSVTAGARAAIALALKLQNQCKEINLFSPQFFLRNDLEHPSPFARSWIQLISQYGHFLSPVLGQLAPLLMNERLARHIWLKAYESSPADMELLRALHTKVWLPNFVRALIDCCMDGVDADLRLMANDWIGDVAPIAHKLRISYGETDPFSDHLHTKDRLEQLGVDVFVRSEFGQNSFLNRPDIMFSRLAGVSPR